LEASLSNPGTYSDKNKFLDTENAYKKAQDELKQMNARYEIVFEKIMALESKN
jgi:ATP-binding cassette subfamily F protein 3